MTARGKASLPEKLPHLFYARPAEIVAEQLVGKILVHHVGRSIRRARVVETEAYVGEHDLASHAAKGRTARTSVMYGPPGRAYVYFIYGMYTMLNVVCSQVDDAQAVLIRAAEPLDEWEADLSGPGKLARAMQIKMTDNNADLIGDRLYFFDDGNGTAKVARSARIGIDYAKEWVEVPLRFYDPASTSVSKKR